MNTPHSSLQTHTYIYYYTHTQRACSDQSCLKTDPFSHRNTCRKHRMIQFRNKHTLVHTRIIVVSWNTQTQTRTNGHRNKELIQSQVMLTATLLFLKGTLHKISSPHHMSSGILSIYTTQRHTDTHTNDVRRMYSNTKDFHTHAHSRG